jgi:WD40 repeat protein
MISISNEIVANVWSPESLVSDIHIGRLKGHSKTIVDGNFLGKAPFFVTIDVTNTLLFWDIKTLAAVQRVGRTISTEISGITVISNNVFWLYGKRFF